MLVALAAAPGLAQSPPEVAADFDVGRYLGQWHEVARFDRFFQRDCWASTVSYARRDDGDIAIVNTCHRDSPDGKLSRVEGRAWVEDPAVPAKLKVRFFWPMSSPYWVLEVAPDYSWALVGNAKKSSCWVLSRTPDVSEALYAQLLEKLKAHGYDVTKLIRR